MNIKFAHIGSESNEGLNSYSSTVRSWAVFTMSCLLVISTIAKAERLSCDHFPTAGNQETSYQYRPKDERCEGLIFQNKSIGKDSFFQVRSVVYGQVNYKLGSKDRFYVTTEPGGFNIRGDIEIIGRSMDPENRYELLSRVQSGDVFDWSGDLVVSKIKILPKYLGILARVKGNQVDGLSGNEIASPVFVPVTFSTNNSGAKTEKLNVTLVSENTVPKVEVYDNCKQDSPKLVAIRDHTPAGYPLVIEIEASGCDDYSLTVELPKANKGLDVTQTFEILR